MSLGVFLALLGAAFPHALWNALITRGMSKVGWMVLLSMVAVPIGLTETAGKRGAADDFRARCPTFLNWRAFEARAIDANPLAGYRKGRNTRAEKVARAEAAGPCVSSSNG